MNNGVINIGFDGGENSLGAAAIKVNSEGLPDEILSLMVYIHDGGKDTMASSQTNSVSRKASGGVARRHRRLLRNSRKRRTALEAGLQQHGYPVIERGAAETFEPWQARLRLVSNYVTDDHERKLLIARALRHMERHRGYASAWVRLETYWDEEDPSPELTSAITAASENDALSFDTDFTKIRFQCELAQLGFHGAHALRPFKDSDGSHQLGSQRRVDVVREWRTICEVQRLSRDTFETFAGLVFRQQRPTVPAELVGNDWLPGYTAHKRAPISSLEHQEFRIWQTVSNLSVKESSRSTARHPLSVTEKQLIADHLLGITAEKERLTWKDIAEKFLEVPPHLLTHSEPDQQLTAVAPANSTVLTMHKLPAKHPVLVWWKQADLPTRRAFISFLIEQTDSAIESAYEVQFSELMDSLTDTELETLLKLSFPAGRSAHSHHTLAEMTAEMRATGDHYVTVRNRLYGAGKDIRPTAATLDTEATHPTLQRILPLAKSFLKGVEKQHGLIDQVTVEHVRGAFLGMQAKSEEALRMRRNERDRQQAVRDVSAAFPNLVNPNGSDVRKAQTIRQQNSSCMYCGSQLVWSDTELDHIVPRTTGGNSTRANLVAVCRPCNAGKGKMTFVEFAASGKRPAVSLDDAVGRVREMLRGSIDSRQFSRMQAEMRRRLRQTSEDEPIDERSLASTAYAATDLRERIMGSLDLPAQKVPVYAGRVVSMARKASGIDRRIELRPGLSSKSRFDRRHHAIDAAVAAMLNQSVARTLAEREDLRRSALTTDGSDDWKAYEGSGPTAIDKFRLWKRGMHALSDLIVEYLASDALVVTQQVRMSGHHAALHKEGREKHARKTIGSAWSPEERAKIVDTRVYEEFSQGFKPSDPMSEDVDRTLKLPNGSLLYGDDVIYLYPGSAARHPLKNASSSEVGASLHHVRLYRWLDEKGRIKTGIVRMYASDLYDLPTGIKGELLKSPLSLNSRAARRMNLNLQDALADGSAQHVGTFVKGDEIRINPDEWVGTDAFSEFLRVYPETRWQLTGWESELQTNLRPLVLSSEGLAKSGTPQAESSSFIVAEGAIAKIFERGARITATKLWKTQSTEMIRRGPLGIVRTGSHPGSSWAPYHAVNSVES